MIFPTTFIVALFLAHIARAVPQACHDATTHESSSTLDGQYNLAGPGPVIPTYKAFFNSVYDNGNNPLTLVACANLIGKFPKFKDVPLFPNIGAAPNTTLGSKRCGALWKITNKANKQSIHFTSIDDATAGFVLSLETYEKLGGKLAIGHVEVEAEILHEFC
jgi:Cerato-platanin